jgi:hypothetical protein
LGWKTINGCRALVADNRASQAAESLQRSLGAFNATKFKSQAPRKTDHGHRPLWRAGVGSFGADSVASDQMEMTELEAPIDSFDPIIPTRSA